MSSLARELNVNSRDLIAFLSTQRPPITSPMAPVPLEVEERARKHFAKSAAMRSSNGSGPVRLPPTVSVKELGDYLEINALEIIKDLMRNGIMATVNQQIDYDTAAIVADNFGRQVEPLELDEMVVAEDVSGDEDAPVRLTTKDELFSMDQEDPANLVERPPVVTVMGHVDHGKTSILDAVRQTRVTAGEAGGITQRIGAYTVDRNNRRIVFLDTPGHEAFTAMRARGAQVTDVAVLVVAADDGVMPQTIEAISHVRASEVPMVVAINKIDKDNANPDRVKQELADHGVVVEQFGGDTVAVEVSAKQRLHLDELLDMVLLVSDLHPPKANPNRLAIGTIIDAHLERGRGAVATVLVQNGTLRVGDNFVVGSIFGKVRALTTDRGDRVKDAGPATPVVVSGLGDVPEAGDIFQVVSGERVARSIATQRAASKRVSQAAAQGTRVTLDDLYRQIQEGELKDLNIVLKADSGGSLEALKGSLTKIEDPKVRIRIVHEGVGNVTESDILLASVSNALLIGFAIKADAAAAKVAEEQKVDVRLYDVIYNVTEDINKAIKGLYEPVFVQVWEGRVEVVMAIRIPKLGNIAGSRITEGKVTRGDVVKVYRDDELLHEGKIPSLKRFKEDVREVAQGYECGIEVDGFQDFQPGDRLEVFRLEREEVV
ncbi:MAG: translation initiation factor IF-2 [Candidatus Dormibacteria bacterium]